MPLVPEVTHEGDPHAWKKKPAAPAAASTRERIQDLSIIPGDSSWSHDFPRKTLKFRDRHVPRNHKTEKVCRAAMRARLATLTQTAQAQALAVSYQRTSANKLTARLSFVALFACRYAGKPARLLKTGFSD